MLYLFRITLLRKGGRFILKKFVIFTDSAADLPKSMVKDLDINYLGLICNIDNTEY
ncbi:DegV family protein, partial [Vibrio cholerae O1]|nr:DegV family protein [Vibrio cholerae O1]